ncbi:DNA repair protein complementing XP-G cells homolog [Sphaeramia orbicularis]|uniref:Excision repair cross-complementation group 5 n=1 Tax=Sphaeramia orbicularis TaxID=375764 RepID=A0A673AIG9_9TELE|nr:DNA repair protein complementing XP-G cells [Sphaeramia orbicularis]
MGVHGLWRLLESTGKPINPETLEGKILAVDISIWLNQAVKGVRDREGNSVQNAHLLTLFNRICKLLFFRIKPVFVFDGDAPLLKKQTLALRRQRKEELSQESKQTNEKLLKTFLKRQAIKAALGDRSTEPLPSLSTVRRNEVDDLYVLPALPPAEEKEKSSSEEEEERELEETTNNRYMHQEDFYEDINSVDINSEEFASLPPEMKHEILKDMKEFSKRRRTMYNKPPERSGDFSQYQLAGLLQRNQLNQRLEGVEKEMSQRSAGSAPQLYGEEQNHNVESQRLISEDHSHYILIKGSSKHDKTPESQPQPAAAPWAGSSLSGCSQRAVNKPEPLWRPVSEEGNKVCGPASKSPKPSVSETSLCSQENASPPSPWTLRAIQNAMNGSSDEETMEVDKKDGSVSPRTLLAIQQALAEEDDDTVGQRSKSIKTHTNHVPQVVISSSEEENEPNDLLIMSNSLQSEASKANEDLRGRSPPGRDGLLDISSEDEMEEVIGERNKAFHFAAQPLDKQREVEENKKAQMMSEEQLKQTETWMGGRGGMEIEEGEKKSTDQVELQGSAFDHHSLSVNVCESPLRNPHPLVPGQKNKAIRDLQEKNGDGVKSEGSEESESEESFIEVSEEEEDDSVSDVSRRVSPDRESFKKEEKAEESLTEAPSGPADVLQLEENAEEEKQSEEDDLKEETETKSDATPAFNEWEQFDMDELEALENSLQVEQNSLREQKQQQERMANTVTGQMYLESQELLRLFGVPFLMAPMEAEAQCAALDRCDHTHGTITDDSDVWLFGGRHVYKNFFSQNKYVQHYQYSDLQNQLGLDRTKLINLAYLLGSDYTEGIPGVGYVTGMEILNEFPGPGLDPLRQFSEWWSEAQEKKRLVDNPRDTKVKKKLRELKLQPGFPNPAVSQAYWHPAVEESDCSFSWGRPQVDMIKEFCLSRFGWSSRRTEETLQPVMKQLNTNQTQLRIDSFFRMEQQEKQSIRSQRLRRAVTCMKRKEKEAGAEEEEGEDTEEEKLSPSKAKKVAQKKPGEAREEEKNVSGGGFLSSQVTIELPVAPLKDVSRSSGNENRKYAPVKPETAPRKVRICNSSSSSSEDSDDGGEVAMVTAKSVFDGNRRGRGAKSTRGRGRGGTRGRGKEKKLTPK